MIATKAEIASTAITGAYDPTTLLIILCIIAYTVLIGLACYFVGQDAAKIKSDNWWAKHDKRLKALEDARHDRAVEGGYKGHETRNRRKQVAVMITGTECNH